MEINRYEFEIIEEGMPRTVGNPSLQEFPMLPSFISRMGSSAAIVARHVGTGIAVTAGAALLLGYAVVLILEGIINAAASLVTGEEHQISFTNLQKATDNFIAFLKENF